MNRPLPPLQLAYPGSLFVPAPELEQWIRGTFIDEKGALSFEKHKHLRYAEIRCLWTNVPNTRQMKSVAATAEIPRPPQGASQWAKARWIQQMEDWFRFIPDFLLTFYAPFWIDCDCDFTRCAMSEHELLHCAQAVDAFNVPRFSSSGRPLFALKGHDAEEHVDIVARYGVGAAAAGVRELVEAAGSEPLIGQAQIAIACGYCLR